MGLRIGEVCRLHVKDIASDKRELTLTTEKSKKVDSMIIPLELFQETVEYVAKNEANIRASNGYVFFKENDNSNNRVEHIDQNYVRKVFRKAVIDANLDFTFGESDEGLYHMKTRSLHRLTTHSLRHYAITHFAKSTNGNVVLTSRFARHSSPEMTMHYISKDKDELYQSIDRAFNGSELNRLKAIQESYGKT